MLLEAGTFNLARPESVREVEDVEAGGGGAEGHVQRHENASGEAHGGLRVRRRENRPREEPVTVPGLADVVMGHEEELEVQQVEVAEGRDQTSMSDAKLRLLLNSPRLREKLRRLIVKGTPAVGTRGPMLPAEGERTTIGPAPPGGFRAAAAGLTSLAVRELGDTVADAE